MLKDFLKSLIISAIISFIACMFIPKEYAAHVVLADEVKETRVLMGISSWAARFQQLNGNYGIQSPEVYSLILDNERLEEEGIRMSMSIKLQTVTIEARDRTPERAVAKLDSIKNVLRNTIAEKRRERGNASNISALNVLNEAKQSYENALNSYSEYLDSHNNTILDIYKAKADSLHQSVVLSRRELRNAYMMYKRSEVQAGMPYPSFVTLKSAVAPISPVTPNFLHIFLGLACIGLVLVSWLHLWKQKLATNGLGAYSFQINYLFAPWTINLLHWGTILLMFVFESDLVEPLSQRFYISLGLWLTVFTITSIVSFQVTPTWNKDRFDFNTKIFDLFFYIAVIITPLHFYQIYKIAAMFNLEEIMYNIRMLVTYGDNNYGILSYALVINKALLIVGLWQYPKISKLKLATLYILNIVSAIALMEKGNIYFAIIFTLFVCFEKKKIKLKTIVATLLIMFALFFVFTIARDYQVDNDEEAMTFTDFFAIYILSGPVAYGKLFMDLGCQFGARTFEIVYLFLDRFGFGPFVVNDKVMDFVWVPLPTNTFTIFQPFYQDFGQKGVAFFAMVYGFIAGILYRLYKNGNSQSSCLYAYLAAALLIQFHQEEIFLSLVHVIQFTFFVFLFTYKKLKFIK